ncbi:Nucleotide exchange factor SIL1 [Zancudomyces culisetae]|uniref:Nucleotide exchange factor SIL1 n=1 Tax=Zancudomyces culisetae TaxID=1213189 RepID=A0A1R1PXD0_ZANCU|nr:Nucleotide exchange factor SIL1 [Zancudomyces culisetae]|eukprot:OMH85577.1 Nucleotide exchange factor SIL1 [Zancudomyces culisetae]
MREFEKDGETYICILAPSAGNLTGSEGIHNVEEKCYPKVFKATDEFQEIKQGQVVEKGLHYKIDMRSGIRMAKLLKEEQDVNESNKDYKAYIGGKDGLGSGKKQVIFQIDSEGKVEEKVQKVGKEIVLVEEALENVNNVKEKDLEDKMKPKGKGAEAEAEAEADQINEKLREYVDFFTVSKDRSEKIKYAELIEYLNKLEGVSHDIDNGVEVMKSKEIYDALANFEVENVEYERHKSLKKQKEEIRGKIAMVFSSATQNNREAQDIVISRGLMKKLLVALEKEKESVQVQRHLVVSILSLLGGNTQSRSEMEKEKGIKVLFKKYKESLENKRKQVGEKMVEEGLGREENKLRVKIMTVIQDFFDDDMFPQEKDGDSSQQKQARSKVAGICCKSFKKLLKQYKKGKARMAEKNKKEMKGDKSVFGNEWIEEEMQMVNEQYLGLKNKYPKVC